MKQLQRWIKQRRRQLHSAEGALPSQQRGAASTRPGSHSRLNGLAKPAMPANTNGKKGGLHQLPQMMAVPPPPLPLSSTGPALIKNNGGHLLADEAPKTHDGPVTPETGIAQYPESTPACSGPAETKHICQSVVPGHAWLHFAFDRAAILQNLSPQTLAPAG